MFCLPRSDGPGYVFLILLTSTLCLQEEIETEKANNSATADLLQKLTTKETELKNIKEQLSQVEQKKSDITAQQEQLMTGMQNEIDTLKRELTDQTEEIARLEERNQKNDLEILELKAALSAAQDELTQVTCSDIPISIKQ